jgi:uncharacterized protein YbaP (TraB family)
MLQLRPTLIPHGAEPMLKRVMRKLLPLAAALFALSQMPAALAKCPDAPAAPGLHGPPCGAEDLARGSLDPAYPATGHHLLWTVTGPKGSAYLLGSLHFGTPALFPLPAEMNQAFASSQALVVETNITALTPAQIAKIVAAKAMYSDGTTLSQVLSPATWRQLDAVMKKFGSSAQAVQRQKPWLVSLSLTSMALKRFGFDENLGIDNHFMKLADKHKPIIQLETFEQQLDFLNGFSDAEQEEMLKETFDDIDKGRAFLVDTLKAWQTGDAHKIDQLLNEEFRNTNKTDEHMYRVLITERNAAMVDKLDRLLTQGGKYFVVLGAAHFVGSDGIVELLKAKGYRVQQD